MSSRSIGGLCEHLFVLTFLKRKPAANAWS
jgi:hypothetical protein